MKDIWIKQMVGVVKCTKKVTLVISKKHCAWIPGSDDDSDMENDSGSESDPSGPYHSPSVDKPVDRVDSEPDEAGDGEQDEFVEEECSVQNAGTLRNPKEMSPALPSNDSMSS
ncbi:hypothetical protein CPB84DRAFT_1853480 [Gymnopilus junonius]|uniref:Uncharacterized protein n=1 Tax=Gymnopilus junonius TaxID=109634 RepID=A0A9P5NC23_GYMJU|nr:hypothetical protein CPB84DRAFT_1853480 [Gymnopilus junonius]